MSGLGNTDEIISLLKTIMPWITGGLAGASLTLFAKIWSEKKRRKILAISSDIRKFSLEVDSEDDLAKRQGLKVSYLGNEYQHLLFYTTKINNVGYGNIVNQEVVILLSTGRLKGRS